jgi:hypothetical protein
MYNGHQVYAIYILEAQPLVCTHDHWQKGDNLETSHELCDITFQRQILLFNENIKFKLLHCVKTFFNLKQNFWMHKFHLNHIALVLK